MEHLFDIVTFLLGLAILSPILFIVAYKIKHEDTGLVFYRGERVGLSGKLFRIFKFRMSVPVVIRYLVDQPKI